MTALAIHGVPALFTTAEHVAISTFTVSATGGTGPYTFSAVGLPTGVSIALSTGVVSGTPTQSGNFDVQFEAVDSVPALVTQNSQFVILSDIVINTSKKFSVPRQQFLVVGKPMTPVGLTVADDTGFASPIRYSASWLPQGLSIDAKTGLITGTPLVYVGEQEVTLYAVDANGVKFSGVLNIEIFPASNAAGASQEDEQSGMLLQMQTPACLGTTGDIPTTSVETLVLDAVAAMTAAYP